MQQKILNESHQYLNDLRSKVNHSDKLANIFKDFIKNIHQSFRTLGMQLSCHTEILYTEMAKYPEENELNLYHYNLLSNSMVNYAHKLEEMLDEMQIGTIEPFEQFCDNYEQINIDLLKRGEEFLATLEKGRESLHQKQQEYLRTAYELEKKKKSKRLQLKAEDLFVDYRQELANVNKMWEQFNDSFKSQFEEYESNELGRSHVTQTSSNALVNQISNIMANMHQNMKQWQVTSSQKLQLIQDKHNSEKQPILKHIIRNRKFNIFKITKQDDFISYEDWKNNIKKQVDRFDPTNLQKYKLEQTLDYQINQLIDFVQHLCFDKVLPLFVQYDYETLFQESTSRLKLLMNISQILENSSTNQIEVDGKSSEMLVIVARSLIINLQNTKEVNSLEFHYLLQFLSSFGRRDKNNNFTTIGSLAQEKTSLLYERDNWQQLLLHLNDKDELKEQKKQLERKISAREVLSLLYQKRRKVKEDLTQEQKLQYLKVLSNIQKISSIMLQLNLKVDFACETIILLAQMCNIKASDIVLLLEQFEQIKIYMEFIQTENHATAIKQYSKDTLYTIIKKSMHYLGLKDQIKITLVNKKLATLNKCIRQLYLQDYKFTDGQSKKRKMLWILQLQPQALQLDYYQLKEKYSRAASQKEAQIEQLIAQDVQRSFNSAGFQSRINHLTLHNLLKLYAYYNNTVSYTQGMNFVMGFVFMVMEDEELTFRCFAQLINLYLKDVLLYDLKYIRVFFYKLDRLIAIYLPKIYQHLKTEGIEAGLYSASWFITIFTGSFSKNEFSTVLFNIWDLILGRGWCGYYQVLLAIFETYEEKILSMKFDKLLQFLNNLAKAEFFTQNPDEIASLKTLKHRANRFKLTTKTLDDLDKEYYLVRQKINCLINC